MQRATSIVIIRPPDSAWHTRHSATIDHLFYLLMAGVCSAHYDRASANISLTWSAGNSLGSARGGWMNVLLYFVLRVRYLIHNQRSHNHRNVTTNCIFLCCYKNAKHHKTNFIDAGAYFDMPIRDRYILLYGYFFFKLGIQHSIDCIPVKLIPNIRNIYKRLQWNA